jgi:hypothetical protein
MLSGSTKNYNRTKTPDLKMNACKFSPDRTYRYVLRHNCSDRFEAKRIVWIGLNPSTADERVLDPTLEAVRRYSMKWGFSEIVMLNLFAYRATNPRDLKRAADSVGPDNDRYLLKETTAANLVIACWGKDGKFLRRDEQVLRMLDGIVLKCLSRNKGGSPRHPLYLGPNIQLQRFP